MSIYSPPCQNCIANNGTTEISLPEPACMTDSITPLINQLPFTCLPIESDTNLCLTKTCATESHYIYDHDKDQVSMSLKLHMAQVHRSKSDLSTPINTPSNDPDISEYPNITDTPRIFLGASTNVTDQPVSVNVLCINDNTNNNSDPSNDSTTKSSRDNQNNTYTDTNPGTVNTHDPLINIQQISVPNHLIEIVDLASNAQTVKQLQPAANIVKAAIRIQHWWRMTSMHLHFCRLKSRGSGSAEGGGLSNSTLSSTKLPRVQSITSFDPLLEHNAECLVEFNTDPRCAVLSFLSTHLKHVDESDRLNHIVSFIARNHVHIDKNKLGELMGQPDTTCVALMQAFINSLEFCGLDFTEALRHLLSHFRLPGEAQKIDRILDQFSVAYHVTNPGMFKDAGTALVLAFSLIMLNTDAHNPAVKRKMTVNDFVRNNRGIDAGADLPPHLLRRLYFEIVCREISMTDDESVKNARIAQSLIGSEKVRSSHIGQFNASKVIRGSLHERKIFLFASHLLIAKIKSVGKYQVRQIYELDSFGLISHCPKESHENNNMVTIIPIGILRDSGSNGSDPYLTEISDDQAVDLTFESAEERDVFLSNVQSAVRAYMQSLDNAKTFVQDQIVATKANIERKYTSLQTTPPTCIQTVNMNVSEPVDIDSLLGNPIATSPETMNFPIALGAQESSTGATVKGATSLRAIRVSMQKDAVKVAQYFQQTRSMLHNRSRNPTHTSNTNFHDSSLTEASTISTSSPSFSSFILEHEEGEKSDSVSVRTYNTSEGYDRSRTNSSSVRTLKKSSCSPSSRPYSSHVTSTTLTRSISISINITDTSQIFKTGHCPQQSVVPTSSSNPRNNVDQKAPNTLNVLNLPPETSSVRPISNQSNDTNRGRSTVCTASLAPNQSGSQNIFAKPQEISLSGTSPVSPILEWRRRRAFSYSK